MHCGLTLYGTHQLIGLDDEVKLDCTPGHFYIGNYMCGHKQRQEDDVKFCLDHATLGKTHVNVMLDTLLFRSKAPAFVPLQAVNSALSKWFLKVQLQHPTCSECLAYYQDALGPTK